MSLIHEAIMADVLAKLEDALVTSIVEADNARAGIVMLGPLQGNPDPDTARISVTVHENDPDLILGGGLGDKERWEDEVVESEVGGMVMWARRFTVKARCLLESTKEDLPTARHIASTVRSRIERALLTMRFTTAAEDGEYVCFGIYPGNMKGSMVQAGGPPDAYDYLINVKFEVQTSAPGGLG